MNEDDAFDSRLLKSAQGYGRLYPSILTRLRSAFDSGDPSVRQVARAMAAAMERADGQRARPLRDAHGLSPQEVRVALHVVDGGTVTTCAETMGLAESTVRSHLKAVFAKTGCKRQSQLAAALQVSSKAAGPD
jgi:DNA-binding CsgD family transcriptional regulator